MKVMDWLHEAVDTSVYVVTYFLPTNSSVIATDAIPSKPMHLQPMSAPNINAIAETKTLMSCIILGLLVTLTVGYFRSPWRKLPPSRPWHLPILGNALQLRDKTWLLSKDCKERFGEFTPLRVKWMPIFVYGNAGEVMYLDGAGQPIVVFNTLKPAFELLERRSGNYSDRPRFIMAHEILNGGLLFALLRYDDR